MDNLLQPHLQTTHRLRNTGWIKVSCKKMYIAEVIINDNFVFFCFCHFFCVYPRQLSPNKAFGYFLCWQQCTLLQEIHSVNEKTF